MSKFRIGDRIRDIDTGWQGVIVGTWQEKGYTVHYDEDDSDEYDVLADDIEFVDKRQAFLKRLQELLRDFDAEIYYLRPGYLYAKLGKECVFFGCERLTSDNILNDNKE